MELEKNDVDISKLFSWGRVFEVTNANDEVEALVYMRLLGDADANRARIYALRKSAELRKNLWDRDNVERWAYVKPFEEVEKEDLVNYIVFFSMREINNQAMREVKVPSPKQPKSNASLSKIEKYQEELDNYPARLKEALNKYIQKEVEKMKAYFADSSKEVLYKKYEKVLIDEFCEQEAFRAYKEMELFLGCYQDDAYEKKFFVDKNGEPSFEVYNNLDSELKNTFRVAYNKLEMDMGELKKLREVTR